MGTNLFNLSDIRNYPERWSCYRGKQLFSVIDNRSKDGKEELLTVSHITGITPRSQKNVTMFQAESLVGYKICSVGDIAANTMWTWQGAIGVSKYDGVVSPSYNVYRQRADYFNPRFLDILLRERSITGVYKSLSTGIRPSRLRLYSDTFLTIRFPVPPREEQNMIVHYLDWKLSEINKLIETKKKEISVIREQRQGFINSSVKKQDDWKYAQLKHFVRSNCESLSNSTADDYEIDYIDISTVGYGYIKSEPMHYYFLDAPSRARRVVHTGDTIISTVRTYLRSVCFIDDSINGCIVSTGFSVMTPKSEVLPQFLSYVLSSDYFIDEVQKASIGVSYPAISDTKLLGIKVAIPDLSQQKEIIAQIEKSFEKANEEISTINEEISLLHELKERLVSDVLSGKVDVRGISVPDFEFVEEESDDEEIAELEQDE